MANKTKRELADMVLRKLNGGITMSSAKYTERAVYGYMDAWIAKSIFFEIKNNDSVNGDWLKVFYGCEKYDSKLNQVYIKLPVKVLSLPKDMGVYQVSLLQGQQTPYVKQPNGAKSVFANLEANRVGDTFVYYVEESKIIVDKEAALAANVLMKLIPSSAGYKNDEPMMYPSNLEVDIIEGTYNLALTGVDTKMINDSNPNTK